MKNEIVKKSEISLQFHEFMNKIERDNPEKSAKQGHFFLIKLKLNKNINCDNLRHFQTIDGLHVFNSLFSLTS